jgi:hypothetical protein
MAALRTTALFIRFLIVPQPASRRYRAAPDRHEQVGRRD